MSLYYHLKLRTLQYHVQPKGARHLVVYVHGFTGGIKTFQNGEKKFLHDYLSKSIQTNCSFASFCYTSRLFEIKGLRHLMKYVPFSKFNTSSNQKLDRNADLLSTYYATLRQQHESISFICHSMGGLLVKQFLIAQSRRGQLHPGFYITLATPHQGVAGAALLGASSHQQVAEMAPFSERLATLASEWPKVSSCIKSKYYSGLDDEIVHVRSSFAEGESEKMDTVEGSHTTICKPTTQKCALIQSLNLVIPGFLNLRTESPVQSQDLVDHVLFQSYRHEYQSYYLMREVDEQLAITLAHGNAWVTGPSGSGKTVLVQHSLVESSTAYFYIDLSPCCISSKPMGYLKSIFDGLKSICKSRGWQIADVPAGVTSSETTVQDISDLIKRVPTEKPIFILVDEVSLSDTDHFSELCKQLLALVNFHTNRMDTTNVARFIIASGLSPKDLGQMGSGDKFDSLFSMIELDFWLDEEISELLDLISTSLGLKFGRDERNEILSFSRGSPRRLKDCVRKYIQLQRSGGASVRKAIKLTGHEEVK